MILGGGENSTPPPPHPRPPPKTKQDKTGRVIIAEMEIAKRGGVKKRAKMERSIWGGMNGGN